jgi:Holliday junction DNA helicase RuvA
MLITVNGIGPKGALALLSVMNVDELRFAILSGDSKAIGKAPGIGPKTAQRVIIDLKDKIDISSALSDGLSSTGVVADERGIARGSARDEAAQALVALGYSRTDAYRAVRGVGTETDDVETVLKQALAVIAQF